MKPTRPTFIRVVPDEIEQHGAAAAILLAHIRFRCQTDGPDRIVREDGRWWQVARRVMGQEVGLTARAVGIALERLGDRVSAKYLAGEGGQPWAYQVTEAESSSNTFSMGGATSSNALLVGGTENVDTPVRKRRHPSTQTQSSLPSRELEEEGRSAAAPRSPQSASRKATYQPRCARHIHDENPPPCGGCGEARDAANVAAEAADKREAKRRDRIRADIDACRNCDQYGRTDDLADCPKHLNFRTAQASA